MTVFQRIKEILFAFLMLAVAAVLIADPTDKKYAFVILLLAAGLALRAIRDICFYFGMARHMVGGKMILFQGVVLLDFALFTASLTDIPRIFILLYLVAIHLFSGIIEILRALEARRTVGGPWKLKCSHGIVNFALAISCFVFIRQASTVLIIYSIGLIYSALIRIISALRKTAFIVIS